MGSNRHYGLRVAAMAIGMLLVARAASAQTLSETVKQVLATNPDVIAAKQERLAREQEIVRAKGGFLPSVDLNAGWGYEYTDSPTTRALGNHNDEELTRGELGLNVRQLLFDGSGTHNEVERQRARTESAGYTVLSTSQKTALDTIEAYLNVLRHRRIVSLAEENLASHQRIKDQIKLRSEAGVARKADLAQIEARVALAQSNVVAAKVNLQDAESTYQRIVGELPGDLESPPSMESKLPQNLDALVEHGLANHPTLKSAEADVKAALAEHDAAKSAFFPRVEADVGANLNDDIAGVDGHVRNLSGMIRMRYNLFRGGADRANRKRTAHLINEAKQVRDRARRQLVESARLSWAAYQATRTQVEYLKKHVDAAIKTRNAYAKQFNIGKRTLLDLLNTENEVFTAKKSLVNAEMDNLFAQYRILADEGELLATMGHVMAPGTTVPVTAMETGKP